MFQKKAVISRKTSIPSIKFGPVEISGLDDYIVNDSAKLPEANLSEWEQVIFEEANP